MDPELTFDSPGDRLDWVIQIGHSEHHKVGKVPYHPRWGSQRRACLPRLRVSDPILVPIRDREFKVAAKEV